MAGTRPKVFVASASSQEGLGVARLVQENLRTWAECSLWKDEDVFRASTVIIENLERALDLFPYAVFVMSPEDSTIIRDQQHLTPRDNIIFELGLFAGRHSLRSVFLLIPQDFKIHLPSDLDGVVTCQYERRYEQGGPPYEVLAACEEIRRRIEEAERGHPAAASSLFWDGLSDVAVIVFGLEHSPDDPPGTHPRISLRDLEAAQTVAGYLARRFPRKRVLTIPASAAGWQRLLPPEADLIVIGGGVSNVEFARHRELYQHWFRLKMGRLCRLEGQRVLHVSFGRLPPGRNPPPRRSPAAIDHFPSESVSRDFALVFSKRRQVYGALRRVIGIAGVKGNGTRAAALYLTRSGTGEDGPDAVLPRPIGAEDELELAVAVDVVLDVIDRIEPLDAVLNGERVFTREEHLGEPCELGRPCAGCSFGEELDLAGTGPQAIIFDLDDTLADTFSLLIEPLEREAATRMAAVGAGRWNAEELAEMLLRLRRERPERLEEELAGLVSEAAMDARRSVLAEVPAERLRLNSETEALLKELRRDFLLVLLTEGDPDLQNRKIDHLKLRDLFDEVIIVPSGTEPAKEEAIAALLVRRSLPPDSVVIVGNRLDREILAGERLRLTTVWLRHGEGSGHIPGEVARPDHVIERLAELSATLERWAS